MAETTGLLGSGLLNALINENKDVNNRTQMASALDSAAQVDELATLDLPSLLNAPGIQVVKHTELLDRKTLRKIKTRRSDSKSPCYSELLVEDIMYNKQPLVSGLLDVAFVYRNFGSNDTVAKDFKRIAEVKLHKFPPKAGEDAIAANAELVDGFKSAFTDYAGKVAKLSR